MFKRKPRDSKGRFLETGITELECPQCGGSISQSAYYSGKRQCQKCYHKNRAVGRTPNTECFFCGEPLYKAPTILKNKNKFACSKCKGKARSLMLKENPSLYKNLVGDNHHNWKGGITKKKKRQRDTFGRSIRKMVLKRDNYTCQMCGDKKNLQVDHIQRFSDYEELRFSTDNCRTLCMDCHYFVTFGRKIPEGMSWGQNRREENVR